MNNHDGTPTGIIFGCARSVSLPPEHAQGILGPYRKPRRRWVRIAAAVLLGAVVVALIGCSDTPQPDNTALGIGVNEFKLTDGTRCASVRIYESVALSCGWGNK